ncbi:PREDICTED: serine/arginine repetitive matrix protein 1-like isoform X2 [Ipomoea nil]|uniref:serine/arginine repetitive matrix protein 1-like isoform X2 n=1 Tax=Ipomoea nil TaxID=35883 RepID=UPI00090142DB|nr:PREDICTED: serine/arginine repetitive matrix protein 1-like isoform X2 [Ipomoea nil]
MGFSDNGKLGHDDEYPYEDHMRSQPAFMVDGGQRKSSMMTTYPNAEGLNNYVVKTQRVVEVVRPVVTRRVLINGKPVREERIVGAYEDGNGGLKENLDRLGKVKDFFNQVQMEASMQPGAPILSRPVGHNLGANPNWHSQNGANWGSRGSWMSHDESPPRHNNNGHFDRPNWGSRASWMSRDESPPSHNGRPFEPNRPNGGTRSTYTTYDDSPPRYHQPNEVSRRSLDTKPNWSSRSESPPPPGIMTRSRLVSYPNSGTRPKWPSSRDDSPPRLMAHPNLGARPNWPIRNDSPPRAMEYYESHPNSNTRPNWGKARDDSPPKPIVNHLMPRKNPGANKPNWSSKRDHSPPRSMMPPELNHPNLGTRPNWTIQNESPPRTFEYYESSHPKSNLRPNWTKARDDSPPRSIVHQPMAHPNSDTTKPNWPSNHDYSPPKYVEKGKDQRNTSPLHNKLEKVTIHDSRGSSPIPNKMNADNARSAGSNKESTQQVRESDQRPNWPNRKAQDGKEEHEKPKSNDGGHIKKGNEEEFHGLANPKSAPVEATTRITSTQEDSSKKPSKNQHDNLDDGNSKKSSSITPISYTKGAGNTKAADFNGRWYKQPGSTLTSATSNVDDLMKVIEEAKRTGAYPTASEKPHWSEITPIPPQGVRVSGPQWNEITPNPPVIDSMEARRRYTTGYPQPVAAAPMGMGFYGGALNSEDAVRIYGGTFLPN